MARQGLLVLVSVRCGAVRCVRARAGVCVFPHPPPSRGRYSLEPWFRGQPLQLTLGKVAGTPR